MLTCEHPKGWDGLGKKGWATHRFRELQVALPGLRAVRLIPAGSTVDSLLGIMATHAVGKAKPGLSTLPSPKDCLGLLDGEGGEGVPTFGQLLLLGVGLEARVGLATRDMVDDIFSPPEVEPGPPVCTHHPLSRSAHDISPVILHAGDILMWNGAYEMEVVKGDSTDGGVKVTSALGAILPPHTPCPRLAAAPC